MVRGSKHLAISHCFPTSLAESCIGNGETRTATHAHMGCWHSRESLYLPCHNRSPFLSFSITNKIPFFSLWYYSGYGQSENTHLTQQSCITTQLLLMKSKRGTWGTGVVFFFLIKWFNAAGILLVSSFFPHLPSSEANTTSGAKQPSSQAADQMPCA